MIEDLIKYMSSEEIRENAISLNICCDIMYSIEQLKVKIAVLKATSKLDERAKYEIAIYENQLQMRYLDYEGVVKQITYRPYGFSKK